MFTKNVYPSANNRGEVVVISGISGVFPDTENVKQLAENLFAKKDLISEDGRRWKLEHPEIPRRIGKIKELNKFDAAFFGFHNKEAHAMDPMSRILLEKAYEAIVDAGYNPKQLRGSRTGVIIGSSFSESEKLCFSDKTPNDGLIVTGSSRFMLANKISYWLDVKGPSYVVDSACSASLYAIEHAYKAIKDGICDAVIVGGCNLCLYPYLSLHYARLGIVSADGKCKSFDESANGFCRSEAVAAIFLQKMKDSRRVYANVVHAKTNCDGYKEQGITYPSGLTQKKLLEEFYEECNVKPSTVDFIEAHGTGTKVGDPEEVSALETVFCPGRSTPLKIGSIKSNIGHTESASGMCAVIKVLLAFEHRIIPPNINFETPRSDIKSLLNGKILVVTEPTPWDRGLAGVNNFGFGGANSHVLLSSNPINKINNGSPSDDLPRLVCTSGRTQDAVNVILSDLEKRTLDKEFVRLLQEVHSEDIPGHIYRGYIILKKNIQNKSIRHIEYFSGEKKPVWFIFTGMGSQWPGMGKDLMKIPVFAESLHKSHRTLESKGINLIEIITHDNPEIFNNILNSFVGIAAIQIALVDFLNTIELKPNGTIGHSTGELGCAYAEGCITSEQMILAAYYRGLVSIETEFIHGSMASIGLGYNAAKHLVPSDIDIACHNSFDNCTISGPSESVEKFVASLQENDTFVRNVEVSNIAYHSRYMSHAGPKLTSYLKKIIPEPKLRSKNWISSSYLETDWNANKAQYSSAEYHTNNLLSPVYFEEACSHVPNNAIVIEIGPHGLLQAILKRVLNKNVVNISLTSRDEVNSTEFLLSTLGKIYEAGACFKLSNIYPHIEFPVSRGTPMIAPLIRWEHSEDYFVASHQSIEQIETGIRSVVISMKNDEFKYLYDHIIDGRNLYPATGYLMLVWETISLMKEKLCSEVPVVFENIRFNRITNISKEGDISFTIVIHRGNGNFEIVEGGEAVVTGRVYISEDIGKECINMPPLKDDLLYDTTNILPLSNKDIYQELRIRGYNYRGLFRGITRANNRGNVGRISWTNNFVTFIDNMLQMHILHEDCRSLGVLTSIQKLIIDPKKHFSVLHTLHGENPEFPIYIHEDLNLISCGGIEVRNIRTSIIARKKFQGKPILEKIQFVPHNNSQEFGFEDIIRICIDLVLENVPTIKIKTVELIDGFSSMEGPLTSKTLVKILDEIPLVQAEVVILADCKHPLISEEAELTIKDEKLPADQSCLMVIASHILHRKDILQTALVSLKNGGFILTRENVSGEFPFNALGLDVCFVGTCGNERIFLIRKITQFNVDPILIKISNNMFSWVPKVQEALNSLDSNLDQKLVVYAEKDQLNGILGFFKCFCKEPSTDNIRCFFIMDDTAPDFSLQNSHYKSQFAKDLRFNVYKNGTWGTYRHLSLKNRNNVKVPHAYVNTLVPGDLTTIKWIEGPLNPNKHKSEENFNLIHIYYASLNFRDIMFATGRLSKERFIKDRFDQECAQGFEYAGKSKDGQRYMGLLSAKAIATVAEGDKDLQWKVPECWSLEEAATIPAAYGTVFYALLFHARLKRGESILIHAGSGGIGQAAINVCSFYGCIIFTTVGTPEKRKFIRKNFPQIRESYIGNSRDTSFEQMVMRETRGKGVDLVLNCLTEEKLQASVRCLSHGGRFIELGKYDLVKNNNLEMEPFLREISVQSVSLDYLFFAEGGTKLKKRLHQCLQKGIDEGAVKPLIRKVFSVNNAEAAFRYMGSGKHVGKVLIKIRDEEPDVQMKPQSLLFEAIPRYLCSNNKSYILCGGLGGFGLELADWLVMRGARKLVIVSRTGISTGYQALRIRIWKSYGTNIIISTEDVTTEEGVKNIIKAANHLGPVSAIFNLAVVLDIGLFKNQTEKAFASSAGPKALATYHFDHLSRKMCPNLEHFVIFSSISCSRGVTAGQTTYGMSNSVMERICEARKAENFPALAIEWGLIGDVGILTADMAGDGSELVINGISQQSIASCLEVMDYFMKQPNTIVASMVLAEKLSESNESRNVISTVSDILGIRDLKTISLHSTLAQLGMDSIMVVELKQTLEREFGVFLTLSAIRNLTFTKLYEINTTVESKDKITKSSDSANQFA